MGALQVTARGWRRSWPELLFAATIVGVTALYAAWSLRQAAHYPNLVVEAPPFVWPERCPPRAYGRGTEVPKLCRVARYQLNDATRLGLVTTGRNNRWYRIGDDALLSSCFRLGDACAIVDRVPGKFVRSRADGDVDP